MDFQPGDRVKTEAGAFGTVLHVSRLTVFVEMGADGGDARVEAYLGSQLTKMGYQCLESTRQSTLAI